LMWKWLDVRVRMNGFVRRESTDGSSVPGAQVPQGSIQGAAGGGEREDGGEGEERREKRGLPLLGIPTEKLCRWNLV